MYGGAIIVVFLGVMIYLFTQTNITYENNFANFIQSGKTVKATGIWVKEKNYQVDKEKNIFSFYMKDPSGQEIKVMYTGTIPNNFESSTGVVVTGKYVDGVFKASDILTKCPSKYEGAAQQSAKS